MMRADIKKAVKKIQYLIFQPSDDVEKFRQRLNAEFTVPILPNRAYSLHHRYNDITILQNQRKGNLSHDERIDIDHDVRPTRQALAAQKILNSA